MKEEIISRLKSLRATMARANLDAYIIPSSDQHLSEYTPEVWQYRQWISGFMGSAGTVVVTAEEAFLWTDSRYFLEASAVLEGTTIQLMKEGMPGVPTISDYLRTHEQIKRVGFFGRSLSANEALSYIRELRIGGVKVVTDRDLISDILEEKKEIPTNPFFNQPLEYAGKSTADKIKETRDALKAGGADTIILTMLDEVAWLFNVRGTDVDYNPVGIAYGMVTPDAVCFYTLPAKLTDEVRQTLEQNGVTIKPYDEIYKDVHAIPANQVVWVDPARTNYAFYAAIPEACTQVHKLSPVTLLKAQKNEAEYQGCRAVMRRDAVALTRFFIWLEKTLDEGGHPSEYETDVKLAEFRAQGKGYVSDSFATIAGYNGNGAIVHYHATPEGSAKLEKKGMFLLDSGGQYHDGTTDITRTISLDGHPTEQQKRDYTNVLKGHISIATAIFPAGTRGSQLDVLARRFLWNECKMFTHGTGHGVGHFLNVHEGPQNIRLEENPTPLLPGMVTSNEPGYYLADHYGIRIENLIRTVPYRMGEDGVEFYHFETVTLCYLDNALVEVSMLTDDEIKWYNHYQQWVYDEISPLLEPAEAEWLRNKTLPLSR